MESLFQRRFSAVLAALALLVTVITPSSGLSPAGAAPANELAEKRQELSQVQTMIENTRHELAEKEKQEKGILRQLSATKREMNQTEVAINDLNHQTKGVESRIQEAEKEIADAQQRLGERVQLLKVRLKDVYVNGNISYLEVLFQANNLMDFLTRMDLMQKIVEQDAKLIRQIEAEEKAIAARKADLEVRREELIGLKNRAESQKARLVQQNQDHQTLLNQVNAQKDAIERMLDDLEATSKRLESIIRALQAQQKRAKMGTGPMAHPLPNYAALTSPYGLRLHPVLKTNRFHTGVDFAGPTGMPIRAAQTGVIIFAGGMGGYGNTVIIDHGGGVSTLYAHMSVIGVGENQTVQKGQTIGQVGSTGWSTGPHLHFEVRVNGNHVNPMPYIGG